MLVITRVFRPIEIPGHTQPALIVRTPLYVVLIGYRRCTYWVQPRSRLLRSHTPLTPIRPLILWESVSRCKKDKSLSPLWNRGGVGRGPLSSLNASEAELTDPSEQVCGLSVFMTLHYFHNFLCPLSHQSYLNGLVSYVVECTLKNCFTGWLDPLRHTFRILIRDL